MSIGVNAACVRAYTLAAVADIGAMVEFDKEIKFRKAEIDARPDDEEVKVLDLAAQAKEDSSRLSELPSLPPPARTAWQAHAVLFQASLRPWFQQARLPG